MTASDDELGLETPAADHLEQLRPLNDELYEEVPVDNIVGVLSKDIEADEADALEQAMPVPTDEEYPGEGR